MGKGEEFRTVRQDRAFKIMNSVKVNKHCDIQIFFCVSQSLQKCFCIIITYGQVTMTRERQKQYEILYAESFVKNMGYDWTVEVPPNEDDWPDLLIKTSNDIFGLEVRDIYVDENRRGSTEKRDESFRQKLLSDLAVKYYAKKKYPIRLEIRGPLDKDSVDKVLDYLLSTDLQEDGFKNVFFYMHPLEIIVYESD